MFNKSALARVAAFTALTMAPLTMVPTSGAEAATCTVTQTNKDPRVTDRGGVLYVQVSTTVNVSSGCSWSKTYRAGVTLYRKNWIGWKRLKDQSTTVKPGQWRTVVIREKCVPGKYFSEHRATYYQSRVIPFPC